MQILEILKEQQTQLNKLQKQQKIILKLLQNPQYQRSDSQILTRSLQQQTQIQSQANSFNSIYKTYVSSPNLDSIKKTNKKDEFVGYEISRIKGPKKRHVKVMMGNGKILIVDDSLSRSVLEEYDISLITNIAISKGGFFFFEPDVLTINYKTKEKTVFHDLGANLLHTNILNTIDDSSMIYSFWTDEEYEEKEKKLVTIQVSNHYICVISEDKITSNKIKFASIKDFGSAGKTLWVTHKFGTLVLESEYAPIIKNAIKERKKKSEMISH